jgi:Fic family protein
MSIKQVYPHIFDIDVSPVRHVRKVPFLPCIRTPESFVQKARRVRELDIELSRFVLKPMDYLRLIEEAFASNVHWSTSLEGNPLSLNEVRRITRNSFSGQLKESPDGPTQEIINHLLVLLYPELFRLPWDKNKICSINQLLLMGTDTIAQGGDYRSTPSSIKEGEDEVFVPAPPEHVLEEISSLLEWVNISSTAYDPIIGATVFFHEFESIHPFEDGNGRTGRSLFHIYLQCNGLKNSHLCRFDEHLLRDSGLYYQLLMYTDYAAKEKRCDYRELLHHFTDAILAGYEAAVKELTKKDLLSQGLDETSSRILTKARERGDWFSRVEAVAWVQGLGEQTIGTKLSGLVEKGILETKGETRAKRFRFRDPMQELRVLLYPTREDRQEKLEV